MTELVEVRNGSYHDSVTLLRVSQAVAGTPGVTAAQVAMATPLNIDLATALGFAVPAGVRPADLLVTLRAEDEVAAAAGLAAIERELAAAAAGPGTGGGRLDGSGTPPVSVRAAAAGAPDAGLVLLSVPGSAVLGEALDAIEAGRHLMVFSDNVPVDHEVALKDAAATRGLLVMGPDCGTAIVSGVGLGFANVLRSSGFRTDRRVGVVAASGTGAQQLCCLLDEAGVGISHVLGVGGRDLSRQVAGRSTLAALAMLDADPATDHIVVISKPPHPQVAAVVRDAAAGAGTPVSLILLGSGRVDITDGVRQVLVALDLAAPAWPRWSVGVDSAEPVRRIDLLRGLFSGGTLADEAMQIAESTLGPIRSNIPLRPESGLPEATWDGGPPDLTGQGHCIIDLGDDRFTVGRGHPMVDPRLRLDLIAAQAADPDVGVLLLDVVLGHAADPDPAAVLAPAIAAARRTAAEAGRNLAVVVSLCGTSGDPQDRERQANTLAAAGAVVFLSNADAARYAVERLPTRLDVASGSGEGPIEDAAPGGIPGRVARAGSAAGAGSVGVPAADRQGAPDLLGSPSSVITAGAQLLAEALVAQAISVTAVQFRPAVDDPPGTSAALSVVLADPRRAPANEAALQAMLAVRATLVDVVPAAAALGLRPGQFLHAGPPIGWDRASGPLRGALIGAMIFEGLADDPTDAERRLSAGGSISLTPCHEHHAVGPMAGVISPSMWLFRLRDTASGAESFCSLNEGLGKVLRYGAYGPDVLDRLRWMSAVLGPALRVAVRAKGEIDISAIIGQMVQMGDEGHNRNRAGTLMLLRELLPSLIGSGLPSGDIADCCAFVAGNDHFFLNLVMPAGKLMGDAAAGIPGSTVVTAMCRNGTDFGIRVSGTGDRWFTGPAQVPEGLYLRVSGRVTRIRTSATRPSPRRWASAAW